MYLNICQQIEFKMNKYRITNPNNKEVRECKSRTTRGKEIAKLKTKTKILNGIKRYLLVKKELHEIAKEKEVDFEDFEEIA